MRNELSGTTAIADGVVGVPGSEPDDTPPTIPVDVSSSLPPNETSRDLAVTSPNGATTLTPDSTGPPNTNEYWFGLITEKEAPFLAWPAVITPRCHSIHFLDRPLPDISNPHFVRTLSPEASIQLVGRNPLHVF